MPENNWQSAIIKLCLHLHLCMFALYIFEKQITVSPHLMSMIGSVTLSEMMYNETKFTTD